MTTMACSLSLGDTEMIVLGEALTLLDELCTRELAAKGPCSPYIVWQETIKKIRAQQMESLVQTSGSFVDPATGERTIWIGAQPPPEGFTKT